MEISNGTPATRETPIGQLPADWQVVPLKTVTSESTARNAGLAFTRADVLGVDNEAGLVPSDRKLGEDFSRYKLVAKHQFAYNPMRLNVGSIGLWREDRTQVVSPDYIVFGCDEARLDPVFLDLFMESAAWDQQVRQSGQGSVRIRYYYRHIGEFLLPLPSLAEQQAIVRVLTAVRVARDATVATLAAARDLKASLLQHLVAFGAVPLGEAGKVAQKETEYGPIPSSWPVKPLSECAFVQTGVAKGREVTGGESVTVPYLRVANVQDGYLDLSEIKTITIRTSEKQRFSLQVGDVLLTEGGDFDKLGRGFIWHGQVADCVHQNHVFAVRVNRELLTSEFLAYLTQSSYGKCYFRTVAHRTTNLACINTTKLKALPVPLPPIDQQQRIVAHLQAVDRKLEVELPKRIALNDLFTTTLHNLMTGRVRAYDLPALAPVGGAL